MQPVRVQLKQAYTIYMCTCTFLIRNTNKIYILYSRTQHNSNVK